MEISRYLAITQEEMASFFLPPGYFPGFMACHFSPYGTGLSGIPQTLPRGSMLILNDRIPFRGHDPALIRQQLAEAVTALECGCLLLDFQQPGTPETQALCEALSGHLPCPVGVSDGYAGALDGPVFLPPVPPDVPLEDHLAPWKGREIWLELAPEPMEITVTEAGSRTVALPVSPDTEAGFRDEALCCRCRAEVLEGAIRFTLWRDGPCLDALSGKAAALGVTRTAQLYQQFRTPRIR